MVDVVPNDVPARIKTIFNVVPDVVPIIVPEHLSNFKYSAGCRAEIRAYMHNTNCKFLFRICTLSIHQDPCQLFYPKERNTHESEQIKQKELCKIVDIAIIENFYDQLRLKIVC